MSANLMCLTKEDHPEWIVENDSVSRPCFSEDQQTVFEHFCEGDNIFMTGPGGSGKTFLIKEMVKYARKKGKNIQVCAMTGCASILLECNAKTIHSWSGIGLGKADDHVIITHLMMNKFKNKPWKNTDILILDEASMCSKRLFDLLNEIGKRIRRNSRPFGGMQIVMSGDFFQLPPVGDKNDPDSQKFCFESPHWEDVFDVQEPLNTVFRQTDNTYVSLLNDIREGHLRKSGLAILQERYQKTLEKMKQIRRSQQEQEQKDQTNNTNEQVITSKYFEWNPTNLLPRRADAERINREELKKISSPVFTFKHDLDYIKPEIEKSTLFENQLTTKYKEPSKKDIEREEKYLLTNNLFYSVLDLKVGTKVMCIVNLDLEAGICNGSTGIVKDILLEDKSVKVAFDNGMTKLIKPHSFESENIPGLRIKQYPLILAWAITIHKSQGATLDSAMMDIGRNIFESGQVYVALSRVKSLDGLYISHFEPHKIRANQKVIEFYKQFDEE